MGSHVRFRSLLAAVLVATACGAETPITPLVPTPMATKAPYTLAPPTPVISAVATAGPFAPGRPYTADDLMPFLVSAPIGFPADLRRREIAEAVADRVSTYDGRPFRNVFFGGSCENDSCEFNLTGLPDFAPTMDDVDIWSFRADLRTGVVSESGRPLLRGLPPGLPADLGRRVRELETTGRLQGLDVLSTQWVASPDESGYLLRYGRGLEEGDPEWLVMIDATRTRIVSVVQE